MAACFFLKEQEDVFFGLVNSEFQKNYYSYFKNDIVQYDMLRKFYSLLDFHRSIRFSEGASARSEADFGFGKWPLSEQRQQFFSMGTAFCSGSHRFGHKVEML